jgi:diguanylate cyclase (GGDEF)-like protein
MGVTPLWNNTYPWIQATVTDLASLSVLLQQAVGRVAATFKADCFMVMGLEFASQDEVLICGTDAAWNAIAQDLPLSTMVTVVPAAENADALTVKKLDGARLPDWLQLPNIDEDAQINGSILTVPIVSKGHQEGYGHQDACSSDAADLLVTRSLQGVMKLWRSANSSELSAAWSEREVEALEVIGSQLGLAYSTLYWRQRLEHARQQAALVGRISRLLNSSTNPNEIVGRIMAELGQGLECDRCILVNLSHEPAAIVAAWDDPDLPLPALEQQPLELEQWQDVVELFQQGGASYLYIHPRMAEMDSLKTWLLQMKAESGLLIPLFLQEDFFGVVVLLSCQPRHYQVEELQTVRQVADHIAIALANIQHYQHLWSRQEDLRQQIAAPFRETLRDELTQLPNQRALERELEQLSAKTTWTVQAPFSVIIGDLDYFKLVNDTYGFMVGDEVLRVVAMRLKRQVRRDTPIYRYSGEEFVIILTETMQKAAMDVAERLRYSTGSFPIATSVGEISVTASFGVAQQLPEQDNNAWDVLKRAEHHVNQAKRKGRDRIYPRSSC